MKFDKDTLVKQRFWFLLAVSVPLAIVGLFMLSSTVRSGIEAGRKKVDGSLKNLKAFGDPKSREWVDLVDKFAGEKEKQKTIVWKDAAAKQADLMTWPEPVEKKYHFRDGRFARDITATRKKGEAGEAPRDDASHFHGTITQADQDSIQVSGADRQPKRFNRGPETRVAINAEPEVTGPTFSSLQVGDQVAITYETGKYFADKLTENERTDYARDYKTQLKDIIAQVSPVNAQGEGLVQFQGWVYNPEDLPPKGSRFFRYVADEWKQDVDFSDEAWMAQEDLWVQREIYRLIAVANDSVAKFTGKGGKEKDKDYVFTNPYWQLTCRVTADQQLKVTIKNLLDQRQDLDVAFLVWVTSKGSPARIKIEGLPRGPAGTPETKTAAGDSLEQTFDSARLGAVPQGVFGVAQVLNWKTAAVKRLDNISMGSSSPEDCSLGHRLQGKSLKSFRPEEKKEEAPKEDVPVPGGRRRRGFGPEMGDSATNLTPNGLIRDRYLDVTPQARRIPVAVAMIVDQNQVERVLAAFADSKLRFLTTQVVMNRYPQSLRPAEAPDKVAGAPPVPAAVPVAPPAQRMRFPPGFLRRGGVYGGGPRAGDRFPGIRPGPPSADQAHTGGDDSESNVELVLYGIVSLYERFPPRANSAAPLAP
jgi:hypothetical protein